MVRWFDRYRLKPLTASLLALAAITFQGQACNYVKNKTAPVDAASLGFGSGSEVEQKALNILSTNCAGCHGSATGSGGVGNILNPQVLLSAGLIVAGQASRSPLYVSMESGRMPPSGPLSTQDLATLKDWIDGGASPQLTAPSSDPLQMLERNSADLYFGDGRNVTLLWDLSSTDASPAAARFAAVFLMDVKVVYEAVSGTPRPTGYEFSNPRIQMLSGEIEVEINGLNVRVNGVKPEGTEPFTFASLVAKGIDPQNVYDGSITVQLPSVSNADRISLGFDSFIVRARTDNPPIPPKPTLSSAVQFTSTARFNINISNDSTARRWCLTANPARPTSTAAPCPGFEGVTTTTGWLTSRPTQYDLVQVGRTINPNETITFYLWVANSDLKISAEPGVAQVVFDNVAPASPVFDSLSVTDMQIANLVNLRDNSDAVAWCVKESSGMNNVQNANGCSFTAGKPSFVGLRGGGTRYVAVFIRDRAGNLATSTIKTVTNPFGQISYTQLTSTTTGARGVFANRCSACHGAGMRQQTRWDMTSYADTVAKKNLILNRIDDETQSMPPTGLLEPRERALIRLWFTQTSTPVQL